MVSRLVLGCGTVGRSLVESLPRGPDDLVVVDPDEDRVIALRGEGVDAVHADPADASVLDDLDRAIDTAIVAGDDPPTNRAAARHAATAYPEACLVAYTGVSPPPAVVTDLETLADRTIDYGVIVGERLLGDIRGDVGERLSGLAHTLRGIDGTLGVFTHDNPDPDAIGAAIALRAIARATGLEADVCYFGEITHQENRALVNLLDLDMRRLEPDAFDLDRYGGIALVDHSRPGINDQLPADTPVDIVIDHHPPRAPIEATFVDIRSEAGATSSLLADYLERYGIDPEGSVATALLYGLRVDTRDFGRELGDADFRAAAYLIPRADQAVLDRVENPSVSGDTIDTIARAITNRRRRGSALASSAGAINHRDALAQAADWLLAMEGISTTLVYGFMDGTLYASARTRGGSLDVGEAMRQAFGQIGSAGGHVDMAGAQVPLGILGEVEDAQEETLEAVVEDVITDRFFEVIEGDRPRVLDVNTDQDTARE